MGGMRLNGRVDERVRQETLEGYGILDTAPEQEFDDLVALASYICNTPISAISLIDQDRQWFKAQVGLDVSETPRNISFCQHTIQTDDLLIVPDAARDDRFKDSPLVTDGPKIRFYAGAPLVATNGAAIGALCIKDVKPRKLSEGQLDALRRIARQVVCQLESRRTNLWLETQTAMMEKHAEELHKATCKALEAKAKTQRALDSLAKSEARQRAILTAALSAIVTTDASGIVTGWDGQAEAVLGWSADEAIGRSLAETILPQLAKSDFEEQITALIAQDEGPCRGCHFEAKAIKKSGEEIYVEIAASAVFLEGELSFTSFIRDLSAEKLAERAIRESEERFRAFAENAVDAIFLHDTSGHILYANQHGCESLGYQHDELLALNVVEIEANFDPEWLREQWTQMKPGHAYTIDGIHRRKDGSEFPVEVKISQIEIGGTPCVLAHARDVTERKKAEAAQAERDRAERANQAKNQFLSRMSHELRTPLNSILGFAQLLEMYDPTDQQKDCVVQILRGGKHLLGLINEILDISRIESGTMTISKEAVLVGEVVQEAMSLVAPLADLQKVSLQVDMSTLQSLWAEADRQRLLQILINLASNGIKYNVDGGKVQVGGTCQDDTIRIWVRDSGMGIGAEMADRVFMPFDRLGVEQRATVEGTGLGLTLSKNLAEAMGGAMWFESELGVGSTFFLELKRGEMATEAIPILANPALEATGGTRRVLYIEDNPSNVSLLQQVFAARSDWTLDVAGTVKDGLAKALLSYPDLILLDLDLPDAPGAEALMRIRGSAELGGIPVLVVSADATPSRVEALMATGANGYMTKPFDIRDLVQCIAATLGEEVPHAA